MNETPTDAVISTLTSELRNLLGPRLLKVVLFGSRARGDAAQDSDYDILVLVQGQVKENRKLVQEAAWQCMVKYNALVSCLVYTEEQWKQRQETPLGWNIRREGKQVA